MKPFDELTPLQKFLRQNIVRTIIYGGFALVLYWSISKIIKVEEKQEAEPETETPSQLV